MNDDNNIELLNHRIERMLNSINILHLKAKKKELELCKISLLKIIEKFFEYLIKKHPESIDLEIVANFLMVITELILLKSNLLLPSPLPPENEIIEILEQDTIIFKEKHWQEYKKYQSLIDLFIEKELKQKEIYFTNINSLVNLEETSKEYNLSELLTAFESVLAKKSGNGNEIIDIKKYEINIEKKMEEILKIFFKNKDKLTFSQLTSNNLPKVEIIITFLALLQLICQGKIDYLQTHNFGEIVFFRKENKKF